MMARPVATLDDWYNSSSDEEEPPMSTGQCTRNTCQHFRDDDIAVLQLESQLPADEEREKGDPRVYTRRRQLLRKIEISTRRPTTWYHPALVLHAIELFPFAASYVETIRIDTLAIDWQRSRQPLRQHVDVKTFTAQVQDSIDMDTYLDRLGLGRSVEQTPRGGSVNQPIVKVNRRGRWEDSLRQLSPMCPLIILLFVCPKLQALIVVEARHQEQFATLLGCLDIDVLRDDSYWRDARHQAWPQGHLRMMPPALTSLDIGTIYGSISGQVERLMDGESQLTAGRAVAFLRLPNLRVVSLCFLTGESGLQIYPSSCTVEHMMLRGVLCTYHPIADLVVICQELKQLSVTWVLTTSTGPLRAGSSLDLDETLKGHAVKRGASPTRFEGCSLRQSRPGLRYPLVNGEQFWYRSWEWHFKPHSERHH